MVGISPDVDAEDGELTPNQVRLFNKLQVLVAHEYVYYRPGSGLGIFVESVLDEDDPTRLQ